MKRTFSISGYQPISRYFYHTGAVASLVGEKNGEVEVMICKGLRLMMLSKVRGNLTFSAGILQTIFDANFSYQPLFVVLQC